jgi:hypothetical protein
MHDDGAERVGIVIVTKEYGREIRANNGLRRVSASL